MLALCQLSTSDIFTQSGVRFIFLYPLDDNTHVICWDLDTGFPVPLVRTSLVEKEPPDPKLVGQIFEELVNQCVT